MDIGRNWDGKEGWGTLGMGVMMACQKSSQTVKKSVMADRKGMLPKNGAHHDTKRPEKDT
jgi:hypothetical protein